MQNKPTRNIKSRLADGVAAWLAFEFSCERGYLFSEQYIAHAVGQILHTRGPKLKAEVPHPTLSTPGKLGRPPSIDFVLHDQHDSPVLAVETKWAGYSDVTAAALVWDAFRLEAFARKTGKPGLLVLAGTRPRLASLFTSSAFGRLQMKGRQHPPLLPLPTGPRSSFVLLRSHLPSVVEKYLNERLAQSPSGTVADSLYCELPQVAKGSGPKGIAFDVYVWEVRSRLGAPDIALTGTTGPGRRPGH
jgi:hypothetical protein